MSIQRQFVLAVVTDINHNRVAYPSCTQCFTKLLVDPTTQRYHCIKCSKSVPSQSVQWRYRLVLTVTDNTDICQVVVFGRTLEQFFGKTATDFQRSLMDLDRSGYPAEALLTEALNKTFHGKYFYFGVKIPLSHNAKMAPTLSCINQGSSGHSQPLLDNTDLPESSNILVYQMVPSNNGVYATVSDFIRQGIKQLRETCDKSKCLVSNNKSSTDDLSVEYSINQSVETTESSLYKSRSFNMKQKSVALSFETSTEESVELVRGDFEEGCATDTIGRSEDVIYDEQSSGTNRLQVEYCSQLSQKDTRNGRSENVVIPDEKSFFELDSVNGKRKKLLIQTRELYAQKLPILSRSDTKKLAILDGDFREHGSTLTDTIEWSENVICDELSLSTNDIRVESFSKLYLMDSERTKNVAISDENSFLQQNNLNGDRHKSVFETDRLNAVSGEPETEQHSGLDDSRVWNVRTEERSIEKVNSIVLPDSEDLEAFLNSFSVCLEISTGEIHHIPLKCVSNHKDDSLNVERYTTKVDSDRPRAAIIVTSATERLIDKLNNTDLPDSEDLDAFLNSFSTSFIISDDDSLQKTCQSTKKLDSIENYSKNIKVKQNSFSLESREFAAEICDDKSQQEPETGFDGKRELIVENALDSNGRHTRLENGSETNSDSGFQLSTSSCDLFDSQESFSVGNFDNVHTELKSSNVYKAVVNYTKDIVNEKVNNTDLLSDEELNETWSELLTIEFSSENNDEDHTEKKENKGSLITLSKSLPNKDSLCTGTARIGQESKEINNLPRPRGEQSFYNESLLNTTDILFDSPEMSVAQEKYVVNGWPKHHAYSLNKAVIKFRSPTNNLRSTYQNSFSDVSTTSNRGDGSIIAESQSPLFELDKSVSKTRFKEGSTVGEMDGIKRVMFSKKLRRISSCRLMDIKMKENKPLLMRVATPKSCLKPSVQVYNNNTIFENVNKADRGMNSMLEESDISSSDSSFFIESSQPTNVRKPHHRKQHTENMFLKNMNKENADRDYLPSTPDLWDSSFDDSDICGELNEAITLETPAPSHKSIHIASEVGKVCESFHKHTEYNPNSKTTRLSMGCLTSTPELFEDSFASDSQDLLPENSVQNQGNKENFNVSESQHSSNKDKSHRSYVGQVLKCLVQNTPGCDNAVISKIPCNTGSKDYFSPDLFGDSSFEDCDSNMFNVPSVLCKQLFF